MELIEVVSAIAHLGRAHHHSCHHHFAAGDPDPARIRARQLFFASGNCSAQKARA